MPSLFSSKYCSLYRVVLISQVPNATGKAGTEAGKAEGIEEGEDDPRREIVEMKR